MAATQTHGPVIGHYYGVDTATLEIECIIRKADGTVATHRGDEVVSHSLPAGRIAEFEIEYLFGLRDVLFVPEPMRGTDHEKFVLETLAKRAQRYEYLQRSSASQNS